MAYIFVNMNDRLLDFSCNLSAWHCLRLLAYEYGWIPEGVIQDTPIDPKTGEPEYGIIPELGYSSNDFQILKDMDVYKLIKALKKGIKEIPDNKICDKISINDLDKRTGSSLEDVWNSETLFEYESIPITYFSGQHGKTFVQQFIDFGEKGSFQIL